MKQFSVVPKIEIYDTCREFCEEYKIGKGDLVFVSEGTYKLTLKNHIGLEALVVNYRKYGSGEPTDMMVEGIAQDIKEYSYQRVFAIGGGTILDVAKLFALKAATPVVDLFQKKMEIVKDKELILIPTTCGTGSEVTNISILELTAIHSKFGLAVDELYADKAILIPELLQTLRMRFFATSSIDALVHSMESYVSPKSNEFTQMFSLQAIQVILQGYQKIVAQGEEARKPLLKSFLIASASAGIAFANAGCGAVHAMSYPLGAAYHVPHGEANYAVFTQVFKTYQALNPEGRIKNLNDFLAGILGCKPDKTYLEIDSLLHNILPLKALCTYGVKEAELETFTDIVTTQQTRLMNNNYVALDKEKVLEIYKAVYYTNLQ